MTSTLIKQIVSQYLYGTLTPPSNLINEDLIRSNNMITTVVINTAAYMSSSAGRFATPGQFDVVNNFFNVSNELAAKSYTLSEILSSLHLSNSAATVNIDQKQYSQGVDYLERVFLFNNTSFTIQTNDSLRFIVSSDGTRHIEGLKIIPLSDNFDFVAGDPQSSGLNQAILPFIDPSAESNGPNPGLGRKVILTFDNSAQTIPTYSDADHINDMYHIADVKGSANQVYTEGAGFALMANDLWSAGITKFLDDHNRPILYGTNGSDQLSANQIETIYNTGSAFTGIGTFFIEDLISYQSNGVVLMGGAGIDFLTGGQHNDLLYGGNGTDTAIYGGNRADYLITQSTDGKNTITITDNNSANGNDGTDVLYNVEKIQFADGTYQYGRFIQTAIDRPVADSDTAYVAINGSVTINVLANDYDPDGSISTIGLTTNASHGSVYLLGNNSFFYTPDLNHTGVDSFTYTIPITMVCRPLRWSQWVSVSV